MSRAMIEPAMPTNPLGSLAKSTNEPSPSSRWPLSELVGAGLLIVAGVALRAVAVFKTGVLVDELTYQYLGAYTWKHGFPDLRPAMGQSPQPFLYHPPFFFFLLGGWFKLWGNDGLYTARLLSVLVSALLLVAVFLVVRQVFGSRVGLVVLLLVALDPWLILINQGVYIENSLMLIVILGVWAYWNANRRDRTNTRAYLVSYALAGLALGAAATYKQIGGYVLFAVVINFMLTRRRHPLGHAVLAAATLSVLGAYFLVMQLKFGVLFDNETIDQMRRTFGLRHAAGLNYGPLTALTAIVDTYWIFVVTILALVVGGLIALVRAWRQFFVERRPEAVFVSWGLAAAIFAAGIALKSPHYFVLWLIPLYVLIGAEAVRALQKIAERSESPASTPRAWTTRTGRIALLAAVAVVALNLWSFDRRYLSGAGDSLEAAISYVDNHVPSNAIVAVIGSAGPELNQSYISFPADSRKELYKRTHSRTRMPYLFVYWSLTNPIPSTLQRISGYCRDPHRFDGFNDHSMVCRLVPGRLTHGSNLAADDDTQILRQKLSRGRSRS